MSAIKNPITLNGWSIRMSGDKFTPLELRTRHLTGKAAKHPNPRFSPDTNITTSLIRGKRNACVVTKSGTHYKLGIVNPHYEARFPTPPTPFRRSLPTKAKLPWSA